MGIWFRNIFLLLAGIGLWTAGQASADRIILKNGTVEESDRIWESDNYVHFILKGTQSVEIRYTKEIVDRIERKSLPSTSEQSDSASQPKASEPTPKKTASLSSSKPQVMSYSPNEPIIEKYENISFYDPRRPEKYWVGPKRKFNTLKEALGALADQYGTTPEWIESHMGNTNKLSEIHRSIQNDLATAQ